MLATGGSAAAAVQFLRDRGARHINLLVIIAAPEGVAEVVGACEDVRIYCCAVDRRTDWLQEESREPIELVCVSSKCLGPVSRRR
jgi:uracil phosphoribosyltransferase